MDRSKAVLVVSFGTSYRETAKLAIGVVERDLDAAFPDARLYRAWTSGFIRKKLQDRDGIHVDSPEEALHKMLAEGIREVLVQPTFFLKGREYEEMIGVLQKYRTSIASVRIGRTLLETEEDLDRIVRAVADSFPKLQPSEALVLMGHGTEHAANRVYADLARRFREQEPAHIYLGTVEAKPDFSDVMEQLREQKPEKLFLAPFLLVAGDHACKDLDGEDPASWRRRAEAAGYQVESIRKGLGEYPAVRQIYVEHAEEAVPL